MSKDSTNGTSRETSHGKRQSIVPEENTKNTRIQFCLTFNGMICQLIVMVKNQFNPVLILLLIIFLSMAFFKVHGATYYFSASSGDDARTPLEAQNPNTPWKTINKLNSYFTNIKPGDKILFKRGEVFYGEIVVIRSGLAGYPIKFGSYGAGAKPVITSFVTVSDWIAKGGGIYEASVDQVSDNLNVVTIGGRPYAMGRYPNDSENNSGYITINSTWGSTISGSGLKTGANFVGGEVVIRKTNWIIDRHQITSHSGTSINFNAEGSGYSPQSGYGFFIQNHPETLDKNGEWFFDKENKRLQLFFNEGNPGSTKVEIATKNVLLSIPSHVGHVQIQDLIFSGANENMIEVRGGSNVELSGCEIKYSGKNALHAVGSSSLTLQESFIEDSYSGGVFLQWEDKNTIIKNNVFNRTHMFPGMGRNGDMIGHVIYMSESSYNGLIEQNSITNSGYSGIYFSGNNMVVKNNYIDGYCLVKDDGAGIYTYTGSSNMTYTNRKVLGNIVLNGKGAVHGTKTYEGQIHPFAEGIYMDDNSSGVEIIGNSIANVSNSGIYIHNARNIVIKENKIYNSAVALQLAHDDLGEPIKNLVISNNQFMATHLDQQHVSVRSKGNDLAMMGDFDYNLYGKPLNGISSFSIQLSDPSKGSIRQNLDLYEWKKLYQKDPNSKNSDVRIPYFEIISVIDKNKISNQSFDATLTGVYCWSPNNDCKTSIDDQSGLDGQSLRLAFPSPGLVTINVGEITSDSEYNLRFSTKGDKATVIKAYLRENTSPFNRISQPRSISIQNQRSEINELLVASRGDKNAVLVLESEMTNVSFLIDNLILEEVQAKISEPDEVFHFAFNESMETKSVSLNGAYMDLEGKEYTGTFTLPPFSSVSLVKTSSKSAISQTPMTQIKVISPTSGKEIIEGEEVTIQLAITEGDQQNIEKVSYYYNDKMISTEKEDVLVCHWKEVPYGTHYIHAKAFDTEGRLTVSDSVLLESTRKITPIEFNEEDFSMRINTGSGNLVLWESQEFEGDLKMMDHVYGTTYTYSNSSSSNEPLFQTERNAAKMGFSLPVPNGVYTVKTFHNELWFGHAGPTAKAGSRVFDIIIEDKLVKPDFDIFLESNNKPTILTFEEVNVTDGLLTIDMVAKSNRASVAGISIAMSSGSIEKNIGGYSFYLNSGGKATEPFGQHEFIGEDSLDDLYISGSYRYENEAASTEKIFQTERNSTHLSYSIPAPNGVYTVYTFHNELWFGQAGPEARAGRRVFDILIENKIKKSNFDIYTENGNKPLSLVFENIEVTDGKIDIEMKASANRASVSGIAIVEQGTKLTSIVSALRASTDSRGDLIDKTEIPLIKEQVGSNENISIFPNPARDRVTIALPGLIENGSILIHSMEGKLLDHLKLDWIEKNGNNYFLSLEHIPNGVFLISIMDHMEVLNRQRLIVTP